MDKYEYKVRADEIKQLIAQGSYAQAAEIADTIDWRRIKSVMMLCTISDLYKINRRYEDARDMLLLAYDRRPGGRTICYSLCELSIKIGDYVQAVEYYKEFVQVAPSDSGRYILQYKIYAAQEVSLEERIEVLEELKKRDYREKWAYELAYLYHRIGLETRCVEECDELILWFGEGKYVIKAMELKMLHQPLTAEQQDYYDNRYEVRRAVKKPAEEKEVPSGDTKLFDTKQIMEALAAQNGGQTEELDIHVKTVDMGEYNTINLQQALAAGLQEVLEKDQEATESAPAATEENFTENPMYDSDTESLDPLRMEEVDEESFETEEIEQSEVFFGETGEISDVDQTGEYYEENAEYAEGNQEYYEENAEYAEGDQEYYEENAEYAEGDQEYYEENAEYAEGNQEYYEENAEYAEGNQEYYEENAEYAEGNQEYYEENAEYAEDNQEYYEDEQKYETIDYETLPEEGRPVSREVLPEEGMMPVSSDLPDEAQLPLEKEEEMFGNLAMEEETAYRDQQMQMLNEEPPKELASVLAQESDGQISLVMPESESLEKQITGQMSIEDILQEWERLKRENQAKREAEVRRQVMEHTGDMFTEFEMAVRDGLLEQLESGAVAGANIDEAVYEASQNLMSDEQSEESTYFEEEDSKDEVEELEEIQEMTGEESVSEDYLTEGEETEEQNEYEEEWEEISEEEFYEAGNDSEEDQVNVDPADTEAIYEEDETYEEEAALAEEISEEEIPEEEGSEREAFEDEKADEEEQSVEEEYETLEEEGEEVPSEEDPVEEYEEEEYENLEGEPIEEEPELVLTKEYFTDTEEIPEEEVQEKLAEAEETAAEEEAKEEAGEDSTEQTASETREEIEHDKEVIRSLTVEERELYAPFIQSKSSREQLVRAIDNISLASYTGNLVITGEEGLDTLSLAKNVVREIQATDSNFSGKVAKISGEALNKRNIPDTLEKLKNGALIIEKSSAMNAKTVNKMYRTLQKENMGIVIILEDTKRKMNRFLAENEKLNNCFTARIDVEAMSNDSLVAFGKSYARELEFAIDDLGVLALHTKIENRQTSDHIVTVIEVKEIVDDAIAHAKRKTLKHFMDVLFGKRYDDEDMIILSEKDFI